MKMRNNSLTQTKRVYFVCILLSILTGVVAGALIFLFKVSAAFLISKSALLYEAVRQQPQWIPLFILLMAMVGLASAVLLKYVPDARGGGIPTAISILRGFITFSWAKSLVSVFISAMLTYFGGVPLGNEGPSVQIGTAAGKGVFSAYGKKIPDWEKHIMTGGACAGFAATTGAPITGLLFAFEEAHKTISKTVFWVSALATLAGTLTSRILCDLTNTSFLLFHFDIQEVLPIKYLWVVVVLGLLSGLVAVGFHTCSQVINTFIHKTLKNVPFVVKVVSVFVISAIIGLICKECTGSGHHIVENVIKMEHTTVILVAIFVLRALLLMFATNSEITGGLFVPTLAFGAMIGALVGKGMVLCGILPEVYYPIIVIAGIAAYLAAFSKIPLMAIAFAAEALCGMANILPIGIAVTIAFLVVEIYQNKSY